MFISFSAKPLSGVYTHQMIHFPTYANLLSTSTLERARRTYLAMSITMTPMENYCGHVFVEIRGDILGEE